ncbi:MAG TPA: hypothetical protein VMV81_08990 [Phycisphaerae bacterium]|nr:hypothetical protein [Phycisphaerae bacterium]
MKRQTQLRWLAATILAVSILMTGCIREKPAVRFYPTWSDDMVLSAIWAKAGTSLKYDSLGDGEIPTYAPGGGRSHADYNQSDFREFTAIVRGWLPRDFIDLRVACLTESGTRETTFVEPEFISPYNTYQWAISWGDVRQQADFAAFKIWQLNPYGGRALPRVSPGRYHVSLVRNGKELCSSDLTISK